MLLRKILCPTDFSEPSLQAVEIGAQWARHYNADFIVLHVVAPIQSPGLVLDRAEIGEAMQAEAARELQGILHERFPDSAESGADALKRVQPMVRLGAPAAQIVQCAQEEDADMIVIATHGVTSWRERLAGAGSGHPLFGSVATAVVRMSPCLVLTTHGDKEEENAA